MLIDWFTVGAQTLNFLILVWLLKRFLYQPILNAIDAREQRIAKELSSAQEIQAQAQQEKDQFQHKNEEFDQQRNELMLTATTAANNEHRRLLEEARQAVDTLRSQRQMDLQREHQNLATEINRLVQKEVFATARKTLSDLADETTEARMTKKLLEQLQNLDVAAKESFKAALAAAESVAVRSTFALTPEQQTTLQNALNEIFETTIPLSFNTSPDLINGIELNVNGLKFGWSIKEYLGSLETSISELLTTPAEANSAPDEIPADPDETPETEVQIP